MADPEMVALALAILFALAVLLAVRLDSPFGNADNLSPAPSSDPRSSRSVPFSGMREVRGSIRWSGPTELDPT